MNINEMIDEWYKGCSHMQSHPLDCNECTLALIVAIDSDAFISETMKKCADITSIDGVFNIANIAMAAGLAAQSVEQRSHFIRARNERTNKKD